MPPLLTSFRPESLQAARDAQPLLPRALLLDTLWNGWLEAAQSLGCVALVCKHRLWDATSVAQTKAAGLRCLSYTVNDEPTVKRLTDLGTDGIMRKSLKSGWQRRDGGSNSISFRPTVHI
ncbi:hypothetical protein WCLP8_1880022 [uncultured Gammaproteobacteria bacterium]